jgi:hypothetical protein
VQGCCESTSSSEGYHSVLFLKGTIAQLAFVLEVRLKLAVQALGVTAHLESVCSCFVVDVDLGDTVGGSGLDHELNLTGALHQRVEVGGLVDGASYGLRWLAFDGRGGPAE